MIVFSSSSSSPPPPPTKNQGTMIPYFFGVGLGSALLLLVVEWVICSLMKAGGNGPLLFLLVTQKYIIRSYVNMDTAPKK